MNQIARNRKILISSHFCSLEGKDKCMQPWLNAVRPSDINTRDVLLRYSCMFKSRGLDTALL